MCLIDQTIDGPNVTSAARAPTTFSRCNFVIDGINCTELVSRRRHWLVLVMHLGETGKLSARCAQEDVLQSSVVFRRVNAIDIDNFRAVVVVVVVAVAIGTSVLRKPKSA